MTVGLQTGEQDVKKPKAKKEGWREQSVFPGSTKFSSDVWPAPVKEHGDSQEGEDGEQGDGEGQGARRNLKRLSLHGPVDGSHRPGHADAQEDVDGVAAGDISNGRVCVCVLDSCYFTGKSVWKKKRFQSEAMLNFPLAFTEVTCWLLLTN